MDLPLDLEALTDALCLQEVMVEDRVEVSSPQVDSVEDLMEVSLLVDMVVDLLELEDLMVVSPLVDTDVDQEKSKTTTADASLLMLAATFTCTNLPSNR